MHRQCSACIAPKRSVTSILVGIVGRAPASIVLSARALNPDHTLLVHSVDTEGVAEVVRGQLGGNVQLVCADPTRLKAAEQVVADALATYRGTTRLFVDITGGTKPLSIGVWEGTRAIVSGQQLTQRSAVYLSQAGALLDADTGEVVENAHEAAIEPGEMIAWSKPDASIRARWQGGPQNVDVEVHRRARVWQQLAHALTDGTWQSTTNPPLCRFTPREPLDAGHLPEGFSYAEENILEVPLRYIQHNVWLEELALAKVARAVRSLPGVRLALSATVRGAGAGNVELDLVATRGARVLVVEAKTVSKSAGGELSKKASHVAALLGPSAKLYAFVPKVFGSRHSAVQSRRDMEANLGRAGQVCATIADLGRFARQHLGA